MEHENFNTSQNPPLQQTAVMWRFCAYKSTKDYERGVHYFEKYFDDHTEMKLFSAKHSAKEKPRNPNYVSMYWRSENAT
jgi:hypothetical protein